VQIKRQKGERTEGNKMKKLCKKETEVQLNKMLTMVVHTGNRILWTMS